MTSFNYIQFFAVSYTILFYIGSGRASHSIITELPKRVGQGETCPVLLSPHPPRNVSQREIGSRSYSSARIIGGHLTDDVLASYFMYVENEESIFCTGILVASNLVIVPAACDYAVPGSYAYFKGKYNGNLTNPKIAITSYKRHPDFDSLDRNSPNIAYVILNETVYGDNGQYALINNNSMEPRERSVVRLLGYGYNESNAKGSNVRDGFPLVQVDVPVVSWKLCNDSYTKGISQEQYCAGYSEGGCSGWYDVEFLLVNNLCFFSSTVVQQIFRILTLYTKHSNKKLFLFYALKLWRWTSDSIR